MICHLGRGVRVGDSVLQKADNPGSVLADATKLSLQNDTQNSNIPLKR